MIFSFSLNIVSRSDLEGLFKRHYHHQTVQDAVSALENLEVRLSVLFVRYLTKGTANILHQILLTQTGQVIGNLHSIEGISNPDCSNIGIHFQNIGADRLQ